jgi:hypothetical protein
MKRLFGLALALVLGLAPGVYAQIGGGNIYGSVADESGAVLAGANVALSGGLGARSTTTGSQGDFRFLNVPAGSYKVTVSLAGFTTVNREITVVTGQNADLTFNLKVASVEESVTVTAEAPIVDAKKVGTSTTLTRAELEKVPNSRDPWAILRTIPGVTVDRVNIAGNESGQQAGFTAKGADTADTMWNLDGVSIDDMSAAGASPTYFDYDSFDEIAVSTGGNDLRAQTGGVGLNFVTKRGTNRWRFSAHGYLAHDDLQWSNIQGTELENDPRLGGSDKADHIQQISDWGGDLGGPIIKDKLWLYGSYGKQDIRLVTTAQTADKTILKSYNVKLNWQAAQNTMVSAFYFNGAKQKFGRSPGLGLQWEDTALWNQDNAYDDDWRPNGLSKIEINHVFSPNFFMNAKYSNYNTGFTLAPRGGLDATGTLDFEDGVGRGNGWFNLYNTRPLKNVINIDGNYFASGMGGNHELKFGFGYKKAAVLSSTIYGGTSGLLGYDFGPGARYIHVARQGFLKLESDFYNVYLGDTFTKGNLTVNAGIRWDLQQAENAAALVPAQGTFPELLPAIDFPGGGVGIEWNDISPRVGFNYALGDTRKTALRASYALYAGKLNTLAVTTDNPLAGSYLAYIWDDTNGDQLPQPGEVRRDLGIQYYGGVDPSNPAATFSPNTIDPDYSAPKDHEFIVGVDHELMADLAMSVAYTWRRSSDQRDWAPRIGLDSSDYSPNAVVSRNGFSAQTFSPDPDLVAASGGGRILMNRPDYHQGYNGLELSLMKRLSNNWMARAAFSWMDHKEYYDGPGAVQNPTRTDTVLRNGISGPQDDGAAFANRAAGSGKGDIFFNAKWQFVANALWQGPGGFELGAALFGRQGFARPIVIVTSAGLDGNQRTMTTGNEIDSLRYPDLWNLDLRLAKNFSFGDRSITLSADLFNVFNSSTELNRNRQASSGAFNRLDEILSPRIARFGIRFNF